MVKTQSVRKSSSSRTSVPVPVPSPSSSSKPAQKTVASVTTTSCYGCNRLITDDIKALQCDGCQSSNSWKCIDCLHITDDVYDQLVGEPSMSLKWFCDPCEKAISDRSLSASAAGHYEGKLDHLISVIEKLMEKYENMDKKLAEKSVVGDMSKLESRIMQLEDRLSKHEQYVDVKFHFMDDKVQDSLIAGVSTQNVKSEDEEKIKKVVHLELDRKSTVENDIERRKRNIIIYRIPEKKMEKVSDRKTSDETFVADLLECVFNIKLEAGDIEKMYRLGRWTEDKARPLLVAFKSHEIKQEIMSNLRKLKETVDKFRVIGIGHDLHPSEREENKRLIKEAQEAYESEESGAGNQENVKFVVVGRGDRRKVIKISKKNSNV